MSENIAYKVAVGKQMLVALLNNRAALERAREEGWYHIPVKSAPRAIEAPRIAFYQTLAFKEEKWSIRYWADVVGRDIVSRRELFPHQLNHSRADLQYYKLRLGPLQTLERPIVSKRGRRLVFIPTTQAKFKAAREINDLFHDSPLEDGLWKLFKKSRIAAERQLFISANRRRYCLDFALFCRRGLIDIECDGDFWHTQKDQIARDKKRDNDLTSDGWAVLRFTTAQLRENSSECLDIVRRTIYTHGGVFAADAPL